MITCKTVQENNCSYSRYGDLLFAAPADLLAKGLTAPADSAPLYHYLYW